MYDVGELSIIMVSLRSRPTCERSCHYVRINIEMLSNFSLPLRNYPDGCSNSHGTGGGVLHHEYLVGLIGDLHTIQSQQEPGKVISENVPWRLKP